MCGRSSATAASSAALALREENAEGPQDVRVLAQKIEALEAQVERLAQAPRAAAVTHVAQANQNYGTVNNITLHCFGQEPTEHVKRWLVSRYGEHPDRFERRLRNNPSGVVAETVRRMHYDRDHPGHWTVRQRKPSSKYLEVFEQEWKSRLRRDVYDRLVQTCHDVLDEAQEALGQDPVDLDEALREPAARKELYDRLEEVLLNGTREVFQWMETLRRTGAEPVLPA